MEEKAFNHVYFLVQVLDPIDGTRGFVKGSEALYVVCCTLSESVW